MFLFSFLITYCYFLFFFFFFNDTATTEIYTLSLHDALPISHSERIGYLPEGRGLYRKMRVLDVLVFLGEMKGIDRRRARQRAEEWLERLGLTAWRLRRIDELSKGMQAKEQVISTVVPEPALLGLDR